MSSLLKNLFLVIEQENEEENPNPDILFLGDPKKKKEIDKVISNKKVKKKEQVTSASLGNTLNLGWDKEAEKKNKKDKEKVSEKEHDTFKVTFGDKDEGKLLGQANDLNKLKKEQGWLITLSPIIDENNFKYFFIYSYDTNMSTIKSKLNSGASIEKWENKKESIEKLIKQVSEKPEACKESILSFIKKKKINEELNPMNMGISNSIMINNIVDKPVEDFSSFNIEQKVIVVNGKKRGATGVVKSLLEPYICVLLEDYRLYTFDFRDLRVFSNTPSRMD